MARIEVADWEGPAADAFHWVFDPEPKRWVKASDAMADASDHLRRYVAELRAARDKAAEARTLWQQGMAASENAANGTGPASPAVAERSAGDSIDFRALARPQEYLSCQRVQRRSQLAAHWRAMARSRLARTR
jgi:hypothetical protein